MPTVCSSSTTMANHALTRHLTAGVRTIFSHRVTSVEDDKRARFDVTYAF